MGIEFSYAAETAFVSPTLLQIGVEHQHMTLVWALSPLVGFFLTPILGSLSDRCPLPLGRRRPFIIAMSLGVLLGLLRFVSVLVVFDCLASPGLVLVPNGELLGYLIGDQRPFGRAAPNRPTGPRRLTISNQTMGNETLPTTFESVYNNSHPWGVFFTVLGTVLLDFDADACQSPARAYLLDVTTSG